MRKQAVQLLTALLQCNPYNASLDVEQIREQYEKEKATLNEMLPKDKSEEEAQKVAEEKAKQWAIIEKELESFDQAELYENRDSLWENASPGEVHERIRHHLVQKKLSYAISLLEEAKEAFPVFKNLEGGEIEHTLSAQLRTIFFMPLFREVAQAEEENNEDKEQNAELDQQKFLVNYYKESLNFAVALNEALPIICTLLGSKSITDVQEAINFFVSAFEFGLLKAMIGVRKMLSLIFSREQAVQATVVSAYKRLYIDSATNGNKVNAVQLGTSIRELRSNEGYWKTNFSYFLFSSKSFGTSFWSQYW